MSPPWKPPAPESITCHPADRPNLDEQLPTARVYGEPLPPGVPILEDGGVTLGTIRVRIEGREHSVTLGRLPEARWLYCDPVTGLPIGRISP